MMKKWIIKIVLCLLVIAAAFAGGSNPDARTMDFHPQAEYPVDLNAIYYPASIMTGYSVDGYTTQLQGLREPSLYAINDPDRTAFRLILNQWNIRPLCIRVEISPDENSGMLYYKRISHYELADEKTIPLSESQVTALLKTMENDGFWSIPEMDVNAQGGLDGYNVIIEGAKGGVYHIVDRWCPQDAVFDISVYFYQLVSPGDWRELFADDQS